MLLHIIFNIFIIKPTKINHIKLTCTNNTGKLILGKSLKGSFLDCFEILYYIYQCSEICYDNTKCNTATSFVLVDFVKFCPKKQVQNFKKIPKPISSKSFGSRARCLFESV